MVTVSEITGLTYEERDCVFFRNYVQAAHYLSWGAKLVDIFVDSTTKIVYVFSKDDHLKFRDRWNNQNKDREEKDKETNNG